MNKERYWTFVCYPESLPDNWLEYLQQTGLNIAISPLHDKDMNPDGTIKKEHYHILLCFNGPTTYNKVFKLIEPLNCTIPQRVLSCKGMIRYFSHKDNPEKYQYNEEDIKTLNGFDIKNFNDLTISQVLQIKREIITIINDNDIYEYQDLIDNLNTSDLIDMFNVASTNTIFFTNYLSSKRNKRKL